jgi:hypothetical protein
MHGAGMSYRLAALKHFQVKRIRFTVENASLDRNRADST